MQLHDESNAAAECNNPECDACCKVGKSALERLLCSDLCHQFGSVLNIIANDIGAGIT